jgi:hypothetical protein
MSMDQPSAQPETQYSLPPPAPTQGFPETWRRIVTDPRGFFAEMPRTGGLHEPLVFLAVCAVLNGLGSLIFGWGLGGAIAGTISFVVGEFIAAGLLTAIAQHLFDGRAGFEQMFRVVAYAAAPLVFLWVPRLWGFAVLYAWFLQIRGVQQVNDFEPMPAVLTVALKIGALTLLGIALGGMRF